jgi:P4 family phage/plasmid primase-like protien
MNENGNGHRLPTIFDDNIQPLGRHSKKSTRATKDRKKKAEEEGGTNPLARLAACLEKHIGKPIKCNVLDWYLYEGGKWRLVEKGRQVFRPAAISVQDLANRNELRADRILKFIEARKQLLDGEKFWGVIHYEEGASNYLLNFANGTMRMDARTGETLEWMKHSPKHLFTASLGTYYEFGGKEPELFLGVLGQVLPIEADRELLLDFFASALLPDARFQCALFCVGNGGNGKSIVTEAIARAFGREARSALTLHHICSNDRKFVYKLEGKLINVVTETDTKPIENNSTFKSAVSGELFETDRLYKDGFSMVTTAKMVFLMNNLPMFKHGTEAENRRIRILHFPNKFAGEKADLMLARKLEGESDAILFLLLKRLTRVCGLAEMSRGSYVSQKVMKSFGANNSIVDFFFEICCETCEPSKYVSKDNLYEIFEEFCRMHDRRVLGYSLFFSLLKKSFPMISLNKKVHMSRQVNVKVCKGVQLKDYGFEIMNRIRPIKKFNSLKTNGY